MKIKYYEYLGRITVRFNDLETVIKFFIADLINKNENEVGLIVCNDLNSFKAVINLLKSLFEYKIKDLEGNKLFTEFFKVCEKLAVKRNTLIHSMYLDNLSEKNKSIRVKSKIKKAYFSFEHINDESFVEIINDIDECYSNYDTLVKYLEKNGIYKLSEVDLKIRKFATEE